MTWPNFDAPPQHENPAEGWEDPSLPDFELIWRIAREHGYSVGLHGSMKRDVDLIAVPWVDGASSWDVLMSAMEKGLNAKRISGPENKPHGRIACNLQIDGWFKVIDLSIVPTNGRRNHIVEPNKMVIPPGGGLS